MRELLSRYDCVVSASPETLALMADVKGEAFADDLFILLGQAERATGGRYANATGTDGSATVSQQRSALGQGLKSIVDFLKGQFTISGSAGGVDYNATNDQAQMPTESPRIMGLSQPVFIAGVVMLLLAVVFLLVRHQQK